jgi:protein-S-isoprenylcysteine O-methyltransferase Ste14
MAKLSPLGIGPRIGIVAIPYLAATIALIIIYKNIFCFGPGAKQPLLYAGIAMLAIGLILYVITAKTLLSGLKNDKLITSGPFRYSQNPLYAVMILLLIPGIALVLNSWLVLTTCLVAYIIFKLKIHSEYEEMEKIFGQEYLDYKDRTPEFFLF